MMGGGKEGEGQSDGRGRERGAEIWEGQREAEIWEGQRERERRYVRGQREREGQSDGSARERQRERGAEI